MFRILHLGLTPGANPYLLPGDPAATDDVSGSGSFTWNGAVGLIGDPDLTFPTLNGVQATVTAAVAGGIIDNITISNPGSGYFGPASVAFGPPGCTGAACQTALGSVVIDAGGHVFDIDITFAGEGYATAPSVTISAPVTGCTGALTLHVSQATSIPAQ